MWFDATNRHSKQPVLFDKLEAGSMPFADTVFSLDGRVR
jgi:hypothetical protein